MGAKAKVAYSLLADTISVFIGGEEAATVEDDYVTFEECQMCAAEFEALVEGVREALRQTKSDEEE